MSIMENTKRINQLEQKLWRIEKLIWYIAGVLSIKFGAEVLPTVTAYIW